MTIEFDSLNPYQNMIAIEGDSAEDAIAKLKSIRTPVQIVSFLSHQNKVYIFVRGDIRKGYKNGKQKRGRP